METVGKKVIKLDFYKGFACQFATANSIILGSRLSIPLSTTHCMVGSLFGIILCNKIDFVKKSYDELKRIEAYRKGTKVLLDIEGKPIKALNQTRGESLLQSTNSLGQSQEKQQNTAAVDDGNFNIDAKNDEQTPMMNEEPIVEEVKVEEKEVVRDENSLNFQTVKKILFFWAITVPVAMGVSYGVTELLLIGIPHP